jgi:aminomethyltransferase
LLLAKSRRIFTHILNEYFLNRIHNHKYFFTFAANKALHEIMEEIATDQLKKTAFHGKHLALGAKMVPFAGYIMPVQYSGVNDEHLNVRQHIGVFDVSHMGEFILKGDGALDLLQRLTSNDVVMLTDGKIQYSCLPNEKGGIVDDLLVYRIDSKTFMLVVNASNIEKDWEWITKHNSANVEIKNISEETSLLAVQGPKAAQALQSLTDIDLQNMTYYTFSKGKFAGCENVLVSATGYTGAGGFEIYVKNEDATKIWEAVFEAGKKFGIKPAGLAARDTLRLEMGYCLYGNDINDFTSPIEAGLGWITKFTKVFTNSSFLLAQKKEGVAKKLVGFEMIDRGIPRKDYKIIDVDGNEIGFVTSGTQSPSLNRAIGMGYVKTDFATPGSEIYISIREKAIKANVVRLPFYNKAQ